MDCDVLIIGAGPSGISAAISASKKGLKVICVDKKKSPGNPVGCAEGVGNYLIPYLPFEIPKEFYRWKIKGMIFEYEDIKKINTGNFWEGYSIDRIELEDWLVNVAKSLGVTVIFDTTLIDYTFSENFIVTEAKLKSKNKELIITPNIVISAEGTEATSLKLIGKHDSKNIMNVYSWEVRCENLKDQNYETIVLGDDFSPPGYAYIFPKSANTANVGVGGNISKEKLKDKFEKFVEDKNLKIQDFVNEKSKEAVWGSISEKSHYGNILLCGDTANHNLKPFIEGILPAIISGYHCGQLCEKEIHLMDFSKLDFFEKHLESHYEDSIWFEKTILSENLDPSTYLELISTEFNKEKFEEIIKSKEIK